MYFVFLPKMIPKYFSLAIPTTKTRNAFLTQYLQYLSLNKQQTEHRFDCFITSAHTGRPSTSTTDENIEAVKIMILIIRIVELLLERHETCGSEDCSKIAKF